ncbi:hypothetical protein C8F01DRAFT_1169024 [Mycena amicta]|nr:hypothetical protein C8F01DRAFT_1169024 [Mycena amicta]
MIWLPLLLLPLCSLQTSYAWARNPSRTDPSESARIPSRHLRVPPVRHAWPTNTTTVEKSLNSSFSGLPFSVDTLDPIQPEEFTKPNISRAPQRSVLPSPRRVPFGIAARWDSMSTQLASVGAAALPVYLSSSISQPILPSATSISSMDNATTPWIAGRSFWALMTIIFILEW